MLGAIIGDIVGSRFEQNSIKTKKFHLLTPECRMTDDSLMTLAIGNAILNTQACPNQLGTAAIHSMQQIGRRFPNCGFGGRFRQWLFDDNPKPYGSYGNGAAMRVSACGFAATSLKEAAALARIVTEVSHNHPEALKGAEATASIIYMARNGSTIPQIRRFVEDDYYTLDFTMDEIRPSYKFDVSCQRSVPQAIEAFLESTGFEDAIRNAVSLGGDSDTIAAIAGGMAQAYYGIPSGIRTECLPYICDRELMVILTEFEQRYGA